MRKIGFIGTGNMGYPLLAGAIKLFGKNEVTYSTPFIDEMEKIKEKTGVEFSSDNIELAKSCKFIVICVKPQFIDSVYRDLSKVDLEFTGFPEDVKYKESFAENNRRFSVKLESDFELYTFMYNLKNHLER